MFVARRMDAAWLKRELEKPGRSQSALARFLGVEHPSIVNRMVSGQRQIKSHEADKIRAYLDATNRDPATLTPPSQALTSYPMLKVRGSVEAGSWREVAYAESYDEELPAPKSIVDSGAYALKVLGQSMNKHYPDGSYVVVQPWAGGPLPVGKHVIIERERPDGLVETTIKEMVRSSDGAIELWPRSTDPRHQVMVPYDEAEGATVSIIGRVTWLISPVP